MREIKFRAWNESLNQMVYGDGEWHKINNGREEICYSSVSILLEFGDNVMQFTGLKDKNGTDIYEGDILDGHEDGLVKVEWSVVNGGWDCIFSDEANIGISEMCSWFGNKAKVIGNIYENTDLLNQGSGSQTCDATEDQPGNKKQETK